MATAWLIECMQVVGEPDNNGLISYRGFGELGAGPEYEATITTYAYRDFSVGRWLWVFQDMHRVQPVQINGRQGVWTLPTVIASELEYAVRPILFM